MGIGICPVCQTRYLYDDLNSTDYVHRCISGNSTLDQEDVIVIGDHQDDSGWVPSGTITVASQQLNIAGAVNILEGTRAGLEGEDLERLSPRGNSLNTHRARNRFNYIEKAGV